MDNIKKIAALICAAAVCTAFAGCSDKQKDKSSSAAAESSADSADESASDNSKPDESSQSDDSQQEESNIGEYLQGVADIYANKNYTLECTLSSTQFEGEISILRAVKGDNVYQIQHEGMGDHGTMTLDGVTYDFDNVCGMYRKSDGGSSLNVVDEIVRLNLEQTDTHEQTTEEDYAVEEYTYTGDTYITVMDFYFDKTDKSLVKYVTTYSVEGQDDITETRVIDRLDETVDETVFNTDFTNTLVDFDSMSEDQRLGFCQGLCASFGITTDNMYEMNITTDKFKTIDYDTLLNLVYTYGTGHVQIIN